jgi:hypothetical protein
MNVLLKILVALILLPFATAAVVFWLVVFTDLLP